MKTLNKNTMVVYIISFIIFILFAKKDLINVSNLVGRNSAGVQFNLITTNSIFAGFLFTSITFFIGVNQTKTVEILERINYMDRVYKNLYIGFINSVFSIILSIASIFVLPNIIESKFINISIIKFLFTLFVPVLILFTLIITIICFLKAAKDLKFIILSIRRKSIIKAPSKESVEKTLKQIK